MRYSKVLALWAWVCGVLAWVCVDGAWARPDVPGMAVYVEDSPAVRELVDEAGRLRGQERLAKAVGVYQMILEQYPHKLMAVGPGLHIDAQQWVYRHLLADVELLTVYRRIYDGEARRELALASTPRPQPKELEQVLARYGLCEAGLEAGLTLAALYLRHAAAQDAATVLKGLQGHPDLAKYAPWWHRLGAVVAVLLDGPGQRYQGHVQSLRDLQDDEALAEVEALARNLARPLEEEPLDSFGTLPAVSVPDPLGVPLWEKTLSTAPRNQAVLRQVGGVRVRLNAKIGIARRHPASSTKYYPVAPVALGDRLYLCDMKSIFALDASSGREVWSYQNQEEADPKHNPRARGLFAAASMGSLGEADQRAVLVRDGYVAGVLGVPSHVRLRRRRGFIGTSLVCLDRQDGQKRWEVQAEALDPSLANADFFGTPLGSQSVIYATVRRSQRAGFQDSYLLAVDAKTGSLVWRRHLFSVAAGGMIRQGLVRMTATAGRLYVADNLGNVACLDQRTGSVVWLTVLGDVPLTAVSEQARSSARGRPPKTSPPVLVQAGLIVAVQGDFQGVVLLDADTGRLVRQLEEVPPIPGSYLAPAGEDVLFVSRQTRLLDGQDLSTKWAAVLGATSRQAPQGVAAVTQDRLLVTTGDQFVIVDLADGQILNRYDMDEPGNVLALQDQIVIAGVGTVRGYLAWDRAYEHLSRQMAQAGDDPDPALALAHVALGAGRYDAVLEAVDVAIDCLARRGSDTVLGSSGRGSSDNPVQRRVFEQLLSLIKPEYALSETLRGHLFDRLAKVTAGPADEVAYHLAVGAFLESVDEQHRAIDHYQAILSVPNLSSQMCRYEKGWRGAGLEAQSRLGLLIEELGMRSYDRYETEAAQMLVDLAGFEAFDPAGLLEIARRYPFSRTGVSAMVQAAGALAKQGDPLAALGQLRRAYRRATEIVLIQRIVGMTADLYRQTDQPDLAVRWLKRVSRRYPQLRPLQGGVPVSIDDLLAQFAGPATATGAHLNSFALPVGQPVVMAGRFLSPSHQGNAAWPEGVTVTASGREIRLHDGPDMAPRWQSPALGRDAQLLAVTGEQILLWYPKQALLSALDTTTGHPVWPAVKVAEQFTQMMSDPQLQAAAQELNVVLHGQHELRLVDLERTAGFFRNTKIGVNQSAVCLADHAGLVVSIDRLTGEILWKMVGPLERVDQLAMDEEVVVLAGERDADKDLTDQVIVTLDALTGQGVIPEIPEKHPIQQLGLNDEGLLIYVTAGQMVACDLNTGEPTWGVVEEGLTLVGDSSLTKQMLLLQQTRSSRGVFLMVDAARGQVIHRVSRVWPGLDRVAHRQASDRDQMIHYAGGRWHVLGRKQALALGADGQVLWADAIFNDNSKNLVRQWISDQYVLLLNQNSKRRGMWSYTLYLLDRAGGTVEWQQDLGPFPEPIDTRNAALLDHRLVIPTGANTVVIYDGQIPLHLHRAD